MEFSSTTMKFSVCGDCRNILKQLKTEKFVVNTTNAGESKITFSEFGSKTVKILCSRCEQCIKIS